MRVDSGKYKGKKLESPTSDKVRPTGDKVKQGLFTKLQFFVQDSSVLDLFSGSGALGIEALSKGAKRVVFVDKDIKSVLLTKQNLKGIEEDFQIYHSSYEKVLEKIEEKFDLILVDPPYASGVYENVLKLIYEKNILNDDGIIVCELPNKNGINCDFFEQIDEKRYGTVKLIYYKHFK